MRAADVVVIGGAATGSSVAMHLGLDPGFAGRVVVVEKDHAYRLAASALSAASIRQQYSEAVNIRMSLYGLAVLRETDRFLEVEGEVPSLGFTESGYLYLAGSDDAVAVLRENHVIQRREGADIALLGPNEIAARFPWLVPDGVALGALGLSGEGWFDGWSLLQGMRRKAKALGAEYVAGEVDGLEREGSRIAAVHLRDGTRIACGHVVNCAGSGGPAVARMAGLAVPVQAKRRSVFAFTCRTVLPACPLIIDTSGVWMRPEGAPGPDGRTFIAGWSPPAADDPDWRDEDPASQDVDWPLFEERVWPALAARIPALAEIRPGRAWTGPYDMNLLDQNALIGPTAELRNLHLCNGFSGHGLQQSPAAGRAIAELIVHGRFVSLDLSALSPARIATGRLVRERNII